MVSSYIFFSNYYSTYRRNFLLYTTENVLPNDNVPMSVGHLDHVLIERSGLFHSWYTDPSLQGKGKQCNSKVSHHRPCRGREPRHRLGQGKSGRQRGTATDQMDKRGTLDQETPKCMNQDAGFYQLSHTWDQMTSRSRAPSSCKQSRRDQDVRRTLKCCY